MAFEFFRKYQRVILYTAGLFALVSFSITGSLMGLFNFLFQEPYRGPSMHIAGRTVEVEQEDVFVARALQRSGFAGSLVMPRFFGRDAESPQSVLAALRRLAVEYGLEPSMDEVDKAIETAVAAAGVDDPAELLGGRGSVGALRREVAEALRVGALVRLMMLGVDSGDAAMVRELLDGAEKITVRAAVLDKEGLENKLEEEGIGEEDLRTWIGELDVNEKRSYGFLKDNEVSLELCSLDYRAFDPAQFEEELADVEITQEQIEQRYALDKERLYRVEPKEGDEDGGGEDGEPREGADKDGGNGGDGGQEPAEPPPGEQVPSDLSQTPADQDQDSGEQVGPQPPPDPYRPLEEVQDQVRRHLQADRVLDALFQKVRDRRQDFIQGAYDELAAANEARSRARTALNEAQAALDEDPGDEELIAARDAAEQESEEKKEAAEQAQQALEERKLEFDLQGVWNEVTAGRKGFGFTVIEGPKGADELKDLGELGTWNDSWAATSVQSAGDFSSLVQHTGRACFHFRVTELIRNPLEPFEDIEESAREYYIEELADERAEERWTRFEEQLLELAKGRIPERVDEIRAGLGDRVEERMTSWRQDLEEEEARAEKELERLQSLPPEAKARVAWEEELAQVRAALAAEEERRAEVEEEVRSAVEEEIEAEAAEEYAAVLEEAAAAADIEVREFGPYRREVFRVDPWFRHGDDDALKFLFGNEDVRALEEGEATETLDDTTGRALYLATCTGVEPATLDDVSRREFIQRRGRGRFSFAGMRLLQALGHSFTLEALQQRWGWQDVGAQPQISEGSSE